MGFSGGDNNNNKNISKALLGFVLHCTALFGILRGSYSFLFLFLFS